MRPRIELLFLIVIVWPAGTLTNGQPPDANLQNDETKADVEKRLAVRADVNLKDDALFTLIDSIHDQTGANIVVDWPAMKAVHIDYGMSIHQEAHEKSAGDVLRDAFATLAKDKAQLVIRDGVLLITTKEGLARLPAARWSWKEHAKDERSQKALSRIDQNGFVVEGTQLRDALEFLHDAYGVPLHIDWQSLRANKIDPNTEVALKLSQIPLGDLLHWVLLEAGGDKPLGFTARNGEVFVGLAET